MIVQRFTDFRSLFADYAIYAPGGGTLAFTADYTIVRSAGSWIIDGFEADQRLQIIGTANNDGYHTIASRDATTITTAEATVTTEGAISAEAEAIALDNAGWEQWPEDLVNLASGPAEMTGLAKPWIPLDAGSPTRLTVNAYAADAVEDADEYDWYLSQRTDVAANQYLQLQREPNDASGSYSGTVRLAHTTLAETELDVTDGQPLTPVQTVRIFNSCYIYCQRRSDKKIRFVDLLARQTSQD